MPYQIMAVKATKYPGKPLQQVENNCTSNTQSNRTCPCRIVMITKLRPAPPPPVPPGGQHGEEDNKGGTSLYVLQMKYSDARAFSAYCRVAVTLCGKTYANARHPMWRWCIHLEERPMMPPCSSCKQASTMHSTRRGTGSTEAKKARLGEVRQGNWAISKFQRKITLYPFIPTSVPSGSRGHRHPSAWDRRAFLSMPPPGARTRGP